MKLSVNVEVLPKALEVDPLRETPLLPTMAEVSTALHIISREFNYCATYKDPTPATGEFVNFEKTVKVSWTVE